MPMRQECKHFESRTYADGETVRKCDLDLAPDAPWRCPENCPKYERRLAAVTWTTRPRPTQRRSAIGSAPRSTPSRPAAADGGASSAGGRSRPDGIHDDSC